MIIDVRKIERAERFNLDLNLAVTHDNGQSVFDFYTINISKTGMLIASNSKLDLDSRSLHMVIDPLQTTFPESLICRFQIVRQVNNNFEQRIRGINFDVVFGVRLLFGEPENRLKYHALLPSSQA